MSLQGNYGVQSGESPSFEGTYRLHLQGRIVSLARNYLAYAGQFAYSPQYKRQSFTHSLSLSLSLSLSPWRARPHAQAHARTHKSPLYGTSVLYAQRHLRFGDLVPMV
jgi:hypothetical protein